MDPTTKEWCWPPDVDLSENQLGAVGAWVVCAALAVNPAVQKAQLAGNGLEEQVAQYLAELLLAHTGLKPLDLSYNQLNDQAGNIRPLARETMVALMSIFLGQGGWSRQDHSEHPCCGSCSPPIPVQNSRPIPRMSYCPPLHMLGADSH